MRKLWLLLLAIACMGVLVVACSGSSKNNTTPTPTPTPTPATFYNFTAGSTGWPHANHAVRVISTGAGITRSVVYCTNAQVSGDWTVTQANLLGAGTAYNVEVWGDLTGTPTTFAGNNQTTQDHTWYFQRGAATATAYNIVFPHGTTAHTNISWKPGTSCPGD